jgi:hypothetical protein
MPEPLPDSEGPIQFPPATEAHPEVFALIQKIADNLHLWIDCGRVPVPSTALGFVQVALAIRAWNAFRAIRVLLETSHWEEALIVTRSLFELLLNVEEIHRDGNAAEEKARRFLLFSELQRYHQARAMRQYMIDTGRVTKDDDLLRRLDIAAESVFAVFRRKKPKGLPHWLSYWCGTNVYELAQKSKNPIRVGQYRVLYSYASSFVHSSPQSVMSTHTQAKGMEEIAKTWTQTEEAQTQMVASFSVSFILEIFFYVGSVFPDYSPLWNFDILADVYRLWGEEPPPLPPNIAAAFEEWKKTRERGGE